jgi:hypothetical protein
MSARPRLMDAMIFNSSVISSRDALSGSLPRASTTACLSVMGGAYRKVIFKARNVAPIREIVTKPFTEVRSPLSFFENRISVGKMLGCH